MRPRRPDPDHQEAVARRLELLSAELAAARTSPDGGHDLDPVDEPAPETHTRIRPAPSVRDPAAAEWAVGPVPEWEGVWAAEPAQAATVREPDPWTDTGHEPSAAASERSSSAWTRATDEPPALPVPGRHASRRAAGHLTTMVPETLRGRITLTPHHLTLIALAVALGLGVTAWWVVRGDAVEQPVAAPVAAPAEGLVEVPDPATGAPAASSPAAGETGDATGEVVVDVAGRVRRPGIVVLPAGSRVADALERAGGVKPRVDLAGLNLARVLVDGEQVLVGVEPAAGSAAGAPGATTAGPAPGAAGALVNINTADQPTLETLPGVGPVTAAAILEWRASNGAFSSVEELVEVNGIGPATLARLLPLVTL